jgi:hypothetical protein
MKGNCPAGVWHRTSLARPALFRIERLAVSDLQNRGNRFGAISITLGIALGVAKPCFTDRFYH